ncbi:hypothetical protein FE257_010108 [Aspergillus nanangensis]|uniref:FAD-binding domain-containing protein n=1 Tax=Aspergillus nanangensis TaxID=2582783 RepID=A0AAD4GSF0_ASPNN|nr:hypothetical protein FE257_010108 [Aspergillus nanangensis]
MKATLRVVIVGGGLGGLACAISCRRAGLNVIVLEKAPEIMQVGAGIQVPSNGVKVLDRLGLLSAIKEKGTQIDSLSLVRYSDGELLGHRELGRPFIEKVGAPWFVIHRADYHRILFDEASRLGADIRLNSNAVTVDSATSKVVLEDGEIITADVVVGADGLWSSTRESILDNQSPPYETGDLAYRATFTREELQSLNDPEVEKVCSRSAVTVWVGPEKHCVFYPLRNGEIYNLVLLGPDNLPAGTRTENGSIHEMRAAFEGWDNM